MGAQYDERTLPGSLKPKEVEEKFGDIREECLYDSGHGGYTGTFAEAQGVVVYPNKVFESVGEARDWLDGYDKDGEFFEGHCQKWGPALAVRAKHKGKEYWIIGAICSS